jgi:hypothetical protein
MPQACRAHACLASPFHDDFPAVDTGDRPPSRLAAGVGDAGGEAAGAAGEAMDVLGERGDTGGFWGKRERKKAENELLTSRSQKKVYKITQSRYVQALPCQWDPLIRNRVNRAQFDNQCTLEQIHTKWVDFFCNFTQNRWIFYNFT